MLRRIKSKRNDMPAFSSNKFVLTGFLLLCGLSIQPLSADVVQYELTLESAWSAENHPVDYPSNAHLSGHVGASHNSDYSLWAPGAIATDGLKELAERGLPSPLDSEIASAIADGSAYQMVRLPGVNPTPGSASRTYSIASSHHLFSIASMLAPSPDWIIGVHDVNLRPDGRWLEEISIDAWTYDAGTDSGPTFRSADATLENREPIALITEAPFEGTPPLGTFTLRLVSTPGDLNDSGSVDASDIRTLCSNLGDANVRYEFGGDETVSVEDVNALVEQHLGTRAGDVNLDGEVGFDDFLQLSQNFGNDFRDWERGDFNCDQTVDFADFLILSRNFGFSAADEMTADGTMAAAAVPEPSAWILFWCCLPLVMATRRKRNG